MITKVIYWSVNLNKFAEISAIGATIRGNDILLNNPLLDINVLERELTLFEKYCHNTIPEE
jgi:hypothetical protein